ncbi:hypothetical protein GCM10025768_16850 [Microbacterium pseudoresistens]|uniref:SseB protein N-terminal domain-containing protein n=1 Tax=Microbacterium pseudoresistens TaxID=640634 RepID=A0A7Y9ES73_9MICO|nr:SseB family protein [Microbacterium pseudoresistens]NYD52962.1 hypothetical protein [Microbacterium pseudoresistens]
MTDDAQLPDPPEPGSAAAEPDELAALALRAEAGEVTHIDLVDAFMASTIYVPSVTDPEQGPIEPVTSRIENVDYHVIASSVAALQQTIEVAQYAVPMDGRVLVKGMNPEIGLLVNHAAGAFAIPKAMLDDLRAARPLG